MATSSITTPLVIKGNKKVEAFLDAVESSAKDIEKEKMVKPPGRLVRDSKELKFLMSKRENR